MKRHTLFGLFAHILSPVADAIRAEFAPRPAAPCGRLTGSGAAAPADASESRPAAHVTGSPVPAGWGSVDTPVPAFDLPDVPASAIPEDVTPRSKPRARKPASRKPAGKPRVMASACRETRKPAKGKAGGKSKPAPKRKGKAAG
jgi:hypothetical protein